MVPVDHARGACVVANVVLLLWIPYTYSGGGGPIGNRYFMGLYPLLLFVTPPLRSALPAIAGLAIGGLFTAKLVLNPFYASYRPAEHVKHGPLRWLPIEKSLLNDLPINVTPERVRIQLAGEPRISAYFLDDNAYPPEGEWFWVKGGSRADLLLRAPVREVTDPNAVGEPLLITGADGTVTVKRFAPYRLKQLRVEIRTGDVRQHRDGRDRGRQPDAAPRRAPQHREHRPRRIRPAIPGPPRPADQLRLRGLGDVGHGVHAEPSARRAAPTSASSACSSGSFPCTIRRWPTGPSSRRASPRRPPRRSPITC